MRTALLFGAVLIAACSGGGADEPHARGKELYRGLACLTCHGARGEGGALAPPLDALGSHWTREQMAVYLVDPQPHVEGDERLSALKRRYSTQMPAFPRLSEEDRLHLADYALALSAARGE